ncbi:hypothetical protein MLD38_021887 [Melastoma candidum]|uniref:Uncharacterized protein n=1 Tax=Melastoma candidum TaxID=119954 RepID=A0ACB9QHF2_9MYRT|nr:hypothetical protein MLD38_021887 [Melastoma candidum]
MVFESSRIVLLFVPLLIIPVAAAHDIHDLGNFESPFAFIARLKGCHKGDISPDILQLKLYLQRLGYLNFDPFLVLNPTEFDVFLEIAIRTYQINFHLKPTGFLDPDTVAKMALPRCGVPDIINGTNWMGHGNVGWQGRPGRSLGSFHSISRYTFFRGRPKWPTSKYHLTYAFLPGTPDIASGPVGRAFKTWSSVTNFTFTQVGDATNSDISIGFMRGNHGDGSNFDGKGGILAHAFAPTTGWLHYDADEAWAVGAVPGKFDLETVGLHEIGHLLGLEHSSDPNAIMYPTIMEGKTKGMSRDDIQGIKALYAFEYLE